MNRLPSRASARPQDAQRPSETTDNPPKQSTNGKNGRNGAAAPPPEVPPHLADAFNWVWLVPNDEDRATFRSAFEVPLSVGHWRRANLSSVTRGDKLILVIPKTGPLHEAGIEAAREAWKTAKRVVIWELEALGQPDCPDMAAYAKAFPLGEEIEWSRAWTRLDDPRPLEPQEAEQSDEGPIEWGQPAPLTVPLSPVPALDPAMIPLALRPWLTDIAERGCIPLEYAAATAIVMLAGVAGRRLGIRPKKEDDWLVIPNLWGAIVGHSGLQKSPPAREAMYPVRRLAAQMRAWHAKKVAEWEAARIVASVEQAVAKAKIRKAAEKGFRSKAQLKEIAAKANAENAIPAPIEPRRLVNDVTLAKIGEIHASNPNGLILFRDELVGFLESLGMQGHESDRSFFLEAWNGNGSYTFDRIGRGQVYIPHCCVSIFGTIQPGPLAKYLRTTFKGEEADGFIPRFQILLYPDPPETYTHIDRQPDHASRDVAYKVFRAISRIKPRALGFQFDRREGASYLHFNEPAQAYFDSWREVLENRLRNGSTSQIFVSHLAKYRSLLPSLALLFHLVDCMSSEPHEIPAVSLASAELAGRWCALLEAHARRTYWAAQDGDLEGPINLADRITGKLPNPFTIRDVQRKNWSGLTSNEEVRRAVEILEARGWLHAAMGPSAIQGGRRTEAFWVNPALSVR